VAGTLAAFSASPALAAPRGRAVANVPSVTGSVRLEKSPRAFDPRTTVIRDWRAEGQRLLAKGDRAGALAAFEKALKQSPDDLVLRRLVGDLEYNLGHPVEAVRSWVSALELAPRDPDLLDRVSRGAAEVGDFDLAARAQARLVDVFGDAVEAQNAQIGPLAEQYVRAMGIQAELAALAGDFTTGEQAANRLLKFAPDRIDGRLALAYVHLQAAEYDEAESLYREVLKVAPDETIALNNLGNIEYMYRDFDAASQLFEKILEVDGVKPYSESIAEANLGELYQLKGNAKDAEYLYHQAIQVQPDGAWGYMGLASLYDELGQYDRAVETMIDGWEKDQNRLTRLNSHYYTEEWAWQRDALIAEIEGNVDLARSLWSRILRGDVAELHKSAAHHLQSLDQLDK
jgi:tetratricopeptide (TPR) repeat protein